MFAGAGTAVTATGYRQGRLPARRRRAMLGGQAAREAGCTAVPEALLEAIARKPLELPAGYLFESAPREQVDRLYAAPEFYQQRTELEILQKHSHSILSALGSAVELVEFSCATGAASQALWSLLATDGWVPGSSHATVQSPGLLRRFYNSQVEGTRTELDPRRFSLQDQDHFYRQVLYVPEQIFGTRDREAAGELLAQLAGSLGANGGILIGVDLIKNRRILENAFNDSQGAGDALNHGVLQQLNEIAGANFSPSWFYHSAFFDEQLRRVELHLVSKGRQTVRIADQQLLLAPGESIRTGCAYKYSLSELADLAATAGLRVRQAWTDDHGWFSLQYLERA